MNLIGWGIFNRYIIIIKVIYLFFLNSHAEVSDCGQYIIVSISRSCDPVNMLWYFDLKKSNYQINSNLEFVKIVDNFNAKYDVNMNKV